MISKTVIGDRIWLIGYFYMFAAAAWYFSRVEFGKMETYLTNVGFNRHTVGQIYHIEVDVQNSESLLYSDYSALKKTDGTTTLIIAGSDSLNGYQEGFRTSARFDHIPGFVQISTTAVVVVDFGNACLRLVDRNTFKTSQFVGQCGSAGYEDGLVARFNNPYSVIKSLQNSNLLLVTDGANHVIRQIDIITLRTTTFIDQAAGLHLPLGIAYNRKKDHLLFSGNNKIISSYNLQSNSHSLIAGSTVGFSDGSLSEAKFSNPRELIALSDTVIIITDSKNHRLRVIDTTLNSTFSICTGTEATKNGPVESCETNYPAAVIIRDGVIYIGQIGAIRSLRCMFHTKYYKIVLFCDFNVQTKIQFCMTKSLIPQTS